MKNILYFESSIVFKPSRLGVYTFLCSVCYKGNISTQVYICPTNIYLEIFLFFITIYTHTHYTHTHILYVYMCICNIYEKICQYSQLLLNHHSYPHLYFYSILSGTRTPNIQNLHFHLEVKWKFKKFQIVCFFNCY